MKIKLFTILCCIFTTTFIFGQNDFKFGKPTAAELNKTACETEPEAPGEILYKKSSFSFDFANDSWTIREKYTYRLKVYNPDELSDWLSPKIDLYDREYIGDWKGYVHNKNGKVKFTKKNLVEKVIEDKNREAQVTFAGVEAGSVVEWQYTRLSPYISTLNSVYNQFDIPAKYVSYSVSIPQYFNYRVVESGFHPASASFDKQSNGTVIYYGQQVRFTTSYLKSVFENVPSLDDEPYVLNINNFRNKIRYELIEYLPPGRPTKSFSKTWLDVAKTLTEHEKVGQKAFNKCTVLKNNPNILAEVSDEMNNGVETMNAIFDYVQDKTTWNEKITIYAKQTPKHVLQNEVGNVADINLALIAILREAGLDANPLLLRTTGSGFLDPGIPSISQLNYVIAHVKILGKEYLLDATNKYTVPNVLPRWVFNYVGIVLFENNFSIYNIPTSLTQDITQFKGKIMPDGNVEGELKFAMDGPGALGRREDAKNEDYKIEDEFEEGTIQVKNEGVAAIDKKAAFETNCTMVDENSTEELDGKIFLTPKLWLARTENPFTAESRAFPIELSNPFQEIATYEFTIPEGYKVEYCPTSKSIKTANGKISYRLIMQSNENKVEVSSMFMMSEQSYNASDFADIKAFFDEYVNLDSDKIILAKIEE